MNNNKKFISVKISPKGEVVTSGKWSKFKDFLKKLFSSNEAKKMEASIKEYLGEAYESELESKKRSGVLNQKTAAEINNLLSQSKSDKDKNNRENILFEQIYEDKKADARLKNAQASAIETETVLKILEKAKELGFDASLSVKDDGQLEIISVDQKKSDKEYLDIPAFLRRQAD